MNDNEVPRFASLISGRHPARTFGAGRVCAEPGCHTRLSMYNPADRCSLHETSGPRHGSAPAAASPHHR